MNIGKIVQVIGPVVDVVFEDGDLPSIMNAIAITNPKKVLTRRRSSFSFNWTRSGHNISTNLCSNRLDFSCFSASFRLSFNMIDLRFSQFFANLAYSRGLSLFHTFSLSSGCLMFIIIDEVKLLTSSVEH